MAGYKRKYQEALMEVRDHVRYGADPAKVAQVIAIARHAGQAYSQRTTRSVDVEYDIIEHKNCGFDLAERDLDEVA